MRRVACYAASSILGSTESRDTALQTLVAHLDDWIASKGLPQPSADRIAFRLRDGRDAEAVKNEYVVDDGRAVELALDEPTNVGRFLTRVCVGVRQNRMHLFAELQAGASDYLLAPVTVDVRCPQIVKSICAARTWTVGGTPILLNPVAWHGRESARKFLALVRHQDRNIPIVAISRYQSQALTQSFALDVAHDVCGLAIVVDLDEEASWELTKIGGKQWACYNGAIRVYWPLKGAFGRAHDHPVWTRTHLIARAGSPASAGARIRHQLRRRFLALSTYAVDEPAELRRLRDDAGRAQFEHMRRVAEESGDQNALAEQYFNESVRLEALVERQKGDIDRLADQVRNLSEAWRYVESAEAAEADDIEPEDDDPPACVLDAVARARREFGDDLVFGAEVDESATSLNEDAGPPDKIYDYLRVLSEMTKARRNGGLGTDMMLWLRNRGVSASGESETILNNQAEVRKRTWPDGVGTRVFEKHLKPNENTSPDRCARIYFDYDDSRKKTVIGYIGRHF
jgi:hypothetical protein